MDDAPPSSSPSSESSERNEKILDAFLAERGLERETLDRCGVVWGPMQCRLAFPRKSPTGDVVGWKIRDLGSGKTYNEPSGVSHEDTVPLAFHSVLPAHSLVMAEGETDFLRVVQMTIPEHLYIDVWCIPGANTFPAQWAPFARGYDHVYVARDGDEAGRQMCERISSLLPGVLEVAIPQGEDVCSLCLSRGEHEFSVLLEEAATYIPQQHSIRRPDRYFHEVGAAGQEHKDKLVRIVMRHVKLKRAGRELIGLCPFHDEKRASFSINPEKGLYKCFGCGAKGDVISYVQNQYGLGFMEAVNYIEEFK